MADSSTTDIVLLSCSYSSVSNNTLSEANAHIVACGISVEGDKNGITGNICNEAYNSGGVGLTANIAVTGSSNTIPGNEAIFSALASGSSVTHTIYLASTAKNNMITGNNIMGKDVTDLFIILPVFPYFDPAGEHTVSSSDPILQGRNSAKGSGNFIVHFSTGQLKINTILGGSYGMEEYVCNLKCRG